jgi:transcriptional regulator of arginine metabolism
MNEITKKQRHQILRRILGEQAISDQVQLQAVLEAEGVVATQATVSRDLAEIGVVKVRIEKGYRYQCVDETPANEWLERFKVMLTHFGSGVCGNGNLVLIKTTPGNANGVASTLDHLDWPDVLGTIAGDDTVLVVANGSEAGARLMIRLRELMEGTASAD